MVAHGRANCLHSVRLFVVALLLECLLSEARRDRTIFLGHGLLHVEPGSQHSARGAHHAGPELKESTAASAPDLTPEHWKSEGLNMSFVARSKDLLGKFAKLCSEGPPALVVAVMQVQPALQKRVHESVQEFPTVDLGGGIFFQEEFDLENMTGMEFVNALLCLMLGVFVFKSFADVRGFWRLLVRKEAVSVEVRSQDPNPAHLSITRLVGLTAYRFYTGFLTATWLPYLLAMEGQYLWSSNQSTFMGCAKLIYGATILTNPILGLVGDRAVRISHGVGRRLFVRMGVIFSAIGIVTCMITASRDCFYSFMFGIFLWRLGEAINDVTTEALVPELVSAEQFQQASAIKAALFLFGGLFGYLLLIAAAGLHYSWLYYAYFFGMFITSIPVLLLLNDDAPRTTASANQRRDSRFGSQILEAYLAPSRAEGGFARACLAVFVFSLGTAPMFFLLLIMRDVVGIKDAVELQQHFSGSSIMFFVSAAVAAVMSGAERRSAPHDALEEPEPEQEHFDSNVEDAGADGNSPLVQSILSVVMSVTLFALMCFIIPVVGFFDSMEVRTTIFYIIASVFGYAFGLSFSQFQGITWQLLPSGIALANAMGFNVMSRLLGLGLGNFVAGLILDAFYVDNLSMAVAPDDTLVVQLPKQAEGEYMFVGYVTMCTASGILALVAAALAYSIVLDFRGEAEWRRKQKSAMMAAAG